LPRAQQAAGEFFMEVEMPLRHGERLFRRNQRQNLDLAEERRDR